MWRVLGHGSALLLEGLNKKWRLQGPQGLGAALGRGRVDETPQDARRRGSESGEGQRETARLRGGLEHECLRGRVDEAGSPSPDPRPPRAHPLDP